MSVVSNLPLSGRVPLLFALIVLLPLSLSSQEKAPPGKTPPDKLPQKYPLRDSIRVVADSVRASRPDSLAAGLRDTTRARADSIFRPIFPQLAGTLDRPDLHGTAISADSMEWFGARYLGDILGWIPGFFPLEQSGEGQYSQTAVQGADWRAVSVASDGRSVIDPATSLFNYYYASLTYFDQVEVITGPRSFLYGLRGACGAMNFVSRNISAVRPHTHILYSEGAEGYSLIDFEYSQNVSRRLNATIGVRRQGTDGIYPNSDDAGWNLRVKFRYHFSENVTLLLSDHFVSTQTGLNGGINYAKTGEAGAFNTRTATLMNTDSYEKVGRHDLDATFIGTFLGDSVNVSKLTLFYSNSLRQYRDEENRASPNGIFIRSDHRSSWAGGQATQFLTLGPATCSFGLEYQQPQIEGSPNLGRQRFGMTSAWAKLELRPLAALDLALFGRTERFLGQSYFGAGADASWRVFRGGILFGGISYSDRPPNFTELYWNDSTFQRSAVPGSEHYLKGEAGIAYRSGGVFDLRASAFAMKVTDRIVLSPYQPGRFVFPGAELTQGGTEKTYGIDGRIAIRVAPVSFELSGTALVQNDAAGARLDRYPRFVGRAGLYFRDRLFADHLNLKAGVQGRFNGAYRGDLFNPEMALFIRNAGDPVKESGSLDLILIAEIGDAYVHFIYENPFSITYFSEPYYAGLPGGIRFGVSWTFFN